MPHDTKRLNGPEITYPYQLFSKLNIKSLKQQLNELVLPNGTRSDGRKWDEHRKIFLKTGVVSQAKGSAYMEINKTKVIVSAFDPREIPNKIDYSLMGEIYCEFKYAPFSCSKRRLHQQDAEERHYSTILKQALESAVCRHEFPNFQVDVYVLVLHNDGSALSAAITASGVALAHAGIPMYDIITSATLSIQGKHKFLDPVLKEENICAVPIHQKSEENGNHGVITIALLSTHEQISQFYQTGYLPLDDLEEALNLLTKSCQEIVDLVQKCLVKHVLSKIKSNVED